MNIEKAIRLTGLALNEEVRKSPALNHLNKLFELALERSRDTSIALAILVQWISSSNIKK